MCSYIRNRNIECVSYTPHTSCRNSFNWIRSMTDPKQSIKLNVLSRHPSSPARSNLTVVRNWLFEWKIENESFHLIKFHVDEGEARPNRTHRNVHKMCIWEIKTFLSFLPEFLFVRKQQNSLWYRCANFLFLTDFIVLSHPSSFSNARKIPNENLISNKKKNFFLSPSLTNWWHIKSGGKWEKAEWKTEVKTAPNSEIE